MINTENSDAENEEREDIEMQMKRSDPLAVAPARASAAGLVLLPVNTNSTNFSCLSDPALLF